MKKSRYLNLGLFLLLLSSALTSCSNSGSDIPQGVITQDSMVQIMADLQLAESRLLIGAGVASNPGLKRTYLLHAIKGSEVDTARFNRSFDFYSSHPEIFGQMYDQVITEISRRQAEHKK